MSNKTTFDPKAKAFVTGEGQDVKPKAKNQEDVHNNIEKSVYVEMGASKWKAFGQGPGDFDDISAVSQNLKHAVDQGVLGGALPLSTAPRHQFDFSIKKPAKNEYTNYYKPVELPPSFSEAKNLYPNEADKTSLKNSIEETRTYYIDYLAQFNDEKTVLEGLIKNGKITGYDARLTKQKLTKLDEAIIYINEQLYNVDKYEKENI